MNVGGRLGRELCAVSQAAVAFLHFVFSNVLPADVLWICAVFSNVSPHSCGLDLLGRAWHHPAVTSASSPCFATTMYQPLLPATTNPYYPLPAILYQPLPVPNNLFFIQNKHFPAHILMFVLSRTHNLFHRFLLKIKRFSSISLQSLIHVFCRAFVTNPSNLGQSPNRPAYHLV